MGASHCLTSLILICKAEALSRLTGVMVDTWKMNGGTFQIKKGMCVHSTGFYRIKLRRHLDLEAFGKTLGI